METTENNEAGKCIVIFGPKNLNKEGCRFFLNANSDTDTFISTQRLRWLSHRQNTGDCYTDEQKDAIKTIISNANNRDGEFPSLGTMNILLFTHPRDLNEDEKETIKLLIRCRADIRYLKSNNDHLLRISIQKPKIGKQESKLFLSTSKKPEEEVSEGILYVSEDDKNLLLKHFTNKFDQEFKLAKRLRLKNDRIVFADNLIKQFRKWCKSDHGINVISLWIGIVGVFMTVIGAIMAIKECI